MTTLENNNGVFPHHPSPVRNVLWITSIALIYFAAARLSLKLILQPEGIAAIWLPDGIFLSAILLTRRSLRPALVGALFVTDLIAELMAGTPFPVSLVYASALAGEAVFSSLLLLRFAGDPFSIRRVRDVAGFLFFAVVLSNALSSTVAAAAATVYIPGTSYGKAWLWWATSDGIGTLLITPFILNWATLTRTLTWKPKRVAEGFALFTSLALLHYSAFRYLSEHNQFSLIYTYLTFPFMLWAAFRFGLRGMTAALLILAAIAVRFTVAGHGINIALHSSALEAVIVLQLTLAVIAVPSLLLTAVVTDRRRAEDRLREREALQSRAEEIAHVGSWQLDLASGRLTWTDEVFRIFGIAPQTLEPTYQLFLDSIHPDDRSAVDATYSGSLQEGKDAYEIDHRIVRRSTGEIRYVHEKCEHVRDASGRIARSVGMVHDVTEQKKAQAILQDRERYITTILENAPIGFAVNTIHDGKGVFVGGKFEDIYGVPRGSLRSVDDYFEKVYRDPAFRENIRARIMADMAAGDAARMRWEDIPIITAAGEKRFITAANIPLLDQDLMVSTVQDVTFRHMAEAALRESEERFRSLVEQAGDGFELLDAEGRYVDVNSASCRQLGYSREELLGMSLQDIDPQVSREQYAETFRSMAGRPAITFETMHRRKDGTTFPVEITTSRIMLGGHPRSLTIVRDITERRRADEARRRQAEELQARNEELTRFNRAATGRELRMIELKREINELCRKSGEQPRYALDFLAPDRKE